MLFLSTGLPVGLRIRARDAGRILDAEESLYGLAEEEDLQFFNRTEDCAAQCALVFGGGIGQWRDYPLLELLRWTDRAYRAATQEEDK